MRDHATPMAFDEAAIMDLDAGKLALDRDSVREKTRDGRLCVKVANISKANVCPYLGKEIPGYKELGLDPDKIYKLFRDPDELRKAAPTLNGVQLLRKHIPVNAEDHQPYDTVGSLGTDAEFVDPYLRNSLFVNAQDAIDGIESGKKRELSAGYHYTPDMTPGKFGANAFDGVMRDIVFNHVALVEDGRAGPDVVVGDSKENLMTASAKPSRFAVRALKLTAGALRPVLALDAKVDILPVFKDVTSKNFADKKPAMIAALKAATAGKLAKDADLDPVVELLDTLEEAKGLAEAVASEEQSKEMEDAAVVEAGPADPIIEAKDTGVEALKGFLKEKGMADDDITKACGMLNAAAADEKDDDKDGAEDEEETAEEKAAREKKEADKEKVVKDAKTAKDNEMKDMVTKPAMDAAIRAASEATAKTVRHTEQAIRTALSEVRPYVGDLDPSLAFDTAADVYRHALKAMDVEGAATIHESALPTILKLQPKAGARPVERAEHLGMDSAASKSFAERFPNAGRIGTV